MGDYNPYKITKGRDQHLKPAGVGTRIMASGFCAVVGAGLGVFAFLAMMSHGTRSTRSIAGATPTDDPTGAQIFSILFWGFVIAGAVIGALLPVVMWPSSKESEED